MKPDGYPLAFASLIGMIALLSSCWAIEKDAEIPPSPPGHQNHPRIFGGLFSRPNEPQAEKQHGWFPKEHVRNVLHGGSVGLQVEFKPLEKVHGFFGQVGKLIPNPFGTGNKQPDWNQPKPQIVPGWQKPKPEVVPEYQKPKPEVVPEWQKPKPEVEPDLEKPKPVSVESEGDYGWEPQDPKGIKNDGPQWEDIGESPTENYDGVDIIQPRIRSRRSVESKVYHVGLKFMSNAKPYLYKINGNDV